MTLREALQNAEEHGRAIGHFNASDLSMIKAIAKVGKSFDVPIIVGVSEGEREFWGIKTIVALINSLREEYETDIFLNADHTHSIEKIKEATEAGFDAVLFDAGRLSLQENIAQTRHVVEYVHQYNYKNGADVLVEGELGYIGGSSVILEEIPKGADINESELTSIDEARQFVSETGVDMLAPAVGNIHGMFANTKNPAIYIERVSEIASNTGIPIVLHGGSGISDDQLISAIHAGVRIIHISTQLRFAWRRGLDLALLSHPKEIIPYKIIPEVTRSVEKVVSDYVKLFMNAH